MITNKTIFDNINFNGDSLSSDGGSILLYQYIQQLDIRSFIKSLPYHDSRKFPVHTNSSILMQLIYRNLLGYFSQADQSVMKNDPLLSSFSFVCSQPTISRFFDRVYCETNVSFKEMMTKQACEYVNKNVQDIILDADSTLVTTSGNQEASAYIHHYSETGYHPLIINEYNSKLLLSALLRTGSSHSSNGIVEELKTVMAYLENNGNIRFRGDSAFYMTELMDFLEENNIKYYIRVKNFKSFKRETLEDMVLNEIDWSNFDHSKLYYGEIEYKVGDAKEARRIVYKVYNTAEGEKLSLLPVVYGVITSDKEKMRWNF